MPQLNLLAIEDSFAKHLFNPGFVAVILLSDAFLKLFHFLCLGGLVFDGLDDL